MEGCWGFPLLCLCSLAKSALEFPWAESSGLPQRAGDEEQNVHVCVGGVPSLLQLRAAPHLHSVRPPPGARIQPLPGGRYQFLHFTAENLRLLWERRPIVRSHTSSHDAGLDSNLWLLIFNQWLSPQLPINSYPSASGPVSSWLGAGSLTAPGAQPGF